MYAYRASSSRSSTDKSRRPSVPEITGVSGKRKVVPSLVNVASSAERLGRLIMFNDRAMPVSSKRIHARTSAIDSATAAAEIKHAADVKNTYIYIGLKDTARIPILRFPSLINQSGGAKQFTHSANSSLSYVLTRCNELNNDDLPPPA